jgi:flagellin FlaB
LRRILRKDQKGQIGIGTMIVFISMVLIAAVAAAVMISVSNDLQHRAKATGMEAVRTSSTGVQVQSIMGYAEAIPGPISRVGIYIRPYAGGEYVSVAGLSIELRVGESIYTYGYNPEYYDANPPGNVFESRAWPSERGSEEAVEIQAQIDELEAKIADEQDRRRPHEDQIAEWEAEIQNLRSELAAVPKGGIDAFGCIALVDPDRSMSQAFPAMTPGDVAVLTITTGGRLGKIGDRLTVDGKVYCESGVPAIIRFTTPSGVPHRVFDLL